MAKEDYLPKGREYISAGGPSRSEEMQQQRELVRSIWRSLAVSSLYWLARSDVYERCTEPRLDLYKETYDMMKIKPRDSVLDIGCGSGRGLRSLRQRFPYAELCGLEVDPKIFEVRQAIKQIGIDDSITIRQGDVEDDLPWCPRPNEDDEQAIEEQVRAQEPWGVGRFDKVSFVRGIYVTDAERSLGQILRILKHNGTAGITTMAPDNKPRHRELEQIISNYCEVPIPLVLPEACHSPKLAELMPRYFNEIQELHLENIIIIRTPEEIEMYRNSLLSMHTTVEGYEGDNLEERWAEGVDAVAMPVIEYEIEEYGAFTDYARMSIFTGENTHHDFWVFDPETDQFVLRDIE